MKYVYLYTSKEGIYLFSLKVASMILKALLAYIPDKLAFMSKM